jgi:hypothetical protein
MKGGSARDAAHLISASNNDVTLAQWLAIEIKKNSFREPNAEYCDGSLDVELGWWKCIKDLTYLER